MGQQDIAEHLQAWQGAQVARLRHLQVQLSPDQMETVEAALHRFMPQAKGVGVTNPNLRGNALYLLCKEYLEREVSS